jgi:hypothetical protein
MAAGGWTDIIEEEPETGAITSVIEAVGFEWRFAPANIGTGHRPGSPSRGNPPPRFGGCGPRVESDELRGRGKQNLMGVSGRNTSQGQRRRKPPGPWKTAEAERSGCGIPRRGSLEATG